MERESGPPGVTAWEESEPDSKPHVANSKAPASIAGDCGWG